MTGPVCWAKEHGHHPGPRPGRRREAGPDQGALPFDVHVGPALPDPLGWPFDVDGGELVCGFDGCGTTLIVLDGRDLTPAVILDAIAEHQPHCEGAPRAH